MFVWKSLISSLDSCNLSSKNKVYMFWLFYSLIHYERFTFITTLQALRVRAFSHRHIYWIHVSCRTNKRKNRYQVIHFLQKK